MNRLDQSIKWSCLLLTAALMLSGCTKTEPLESPAVESTTVESTTDEGITDESTTDESTTFENTIEESSTTADEPESLANGISVTEVENGLFLLEEGNEYQQDLDGDGIAETIRYQIREDEYYRSPEIYINGSLLFSDQDFYGFSPKVYLTDIDKADHYREIFVYATVDSDSTQAVGFLRYQNNTLKVMNNLSGQTILGGAGSYFRDQLIEMKGDGTIVINIDTPVYTNMFGCYYVPISFQLEGDTLVEIPQDYYTWSDERPGYVVNSSFTAMTEPGGSEAAFTASPGELVKFDGFCILNGQFHGRVTNSAGVSGWLPEIEALSPGEEGAYFEEVMVWG